MSSYEDSFESSSSSSASRRDSASLSSTDRPLADAGAGDVSAPVPEPTVASPVLVSVPVAVNVLNPSGSISSEAVPAPRATPMDDATDTTEPRPRDGHISSLVMRDSCGGTTSGLDVAGASLPLDPIAVFPVSVPSNTHSTVTSTRMSVGSAPSFRDDRTNMANIAPYLQHFQDLAGYVAFGGSEPRGSGQRTVGSTDHTGQSASFTIREPAQKLMEEEEELPHEEPKAISTPSHATQVPHSDTVLPVATASTDDKPPSSPYLSSVFSTVTQHIKNATPGVISTDKGSPKQAETPGPSSEHRKAETASSHRSIGTAAPLTNSAQPTLSLGPPDLGGAPYAAVLHTDPLPLQIQLPALPSPSFAVRSTEPPPLGLGPPSNVLPGFPPSVTPAVTAAATSSIVASTAARDVPPLPALRADAAPMDPKLVELRETSEAVERLVKAFATLRGHAPPHDATKRQPVGESATRDEFSSTARHQSGSPHSVTERTTTRPRHLLVAPRPLPSASADEVAAMEANTKLLEEVMLTFVVELLQKEGGSTKPTQTVRRPRSASSHCVVHAQAFRTGGSGIATPDSAGRCGGRSWTGDVTSMLDGEMPAFSPPDEDASEVLFYSIREALAKYVLAHVLPGRRCKSTPTGSGSIQPVSSVLAYVLLLDLLTVCHDITEMLSCDPPATVGGILVRYNGDNATELLARQAIHCLPFEVLQPQSQRSLGKPIFRLEYWVTGDKMWTVVQAITDTIREHIVHSTDAVLSSLSVNSDTETSQASLVPPRSALFSVVTAPTHTTQRSPGDTLVNDGVVPRSVKSRAPRRRVLAPANKTAEWLNVNEAGMSSMAHAVSVVTTNMLSKDPGYAWLKEADDYTDLSRIVCETVCELLQDTAISAAVERRAEAQFAQCRKARESLRKSDRSNKEKSIIEKAEKEAERVVQRILQEMLVQEMDAK